MESDKVKRAIEIEERETEKEKDLNLPG